MTAAYQIPLQEGPQSFVVPLAGVTYRMRLWWCDGVYPAWMLDLATESGTTLTAGLPLLPGDDLLAQHTHLGVGGSLYVISDGAPTFDSLGATTQLYFVPTT